MFYKESQFWCYCAMKNRLKELRKERGLTAQGLAELAGTYQQQIHRLENGNRRITDDWLERLSRALGCTPGDIVPGLAVFGGSGDTQAQVDTELLARALGAVQRAAAEQKVTLTEDQMADAATAVYQQMAAGNIEALPMAAKSVVGLLGRRAARGG